MLRKIAGRRPRSPARRAARRRGRPRRTAAAPVRRGAEGAPARDALTGAIARRAAALARVPGGTVLRVETDGDHGSPHEAHVRRSDGTELEVLVSRDFEVTAVKALVPRS